MILNFCFGDERIECKFVLLFFSFKCSGNFCYRWFLGFLPPEVEYLADSPSYANVKTKDYPDPHLCALTRNCDFDPTLHVEHFLNLWISLIGQVVSMTTFLFSPNNFIWGPQKSPVTPCKSRTCEVLTLGVSSVICEPFRTWCWKENSWKIQQKIPH